VVNDKPLFKQDFEWLTSNTQVAYPFVEHVDTLSDLVVDAFVMYDPAKGHEVRLSLLTDPTIPADVEFRYRDGTVAFSATTAECQLRLMGPWTVLEWVNGSLMARLLLKTDLLDGYSWPATPAEAWLVGHATQPVQNRLQALISDLSRFTGFVELIQGYNIALTAEVTDNPDSARAVTQVTIDAQAGNGLGRYPSCDFDNPPILTINGVAADQQGNFKLVPFDCYRGEAPIENPLTGPPWRLTANTFKLHNHCSPCCDCADYVYVYDVLMRQVYDLAKIVSDRFYKVRDNYAKLYTKMKAQKTAREVPKVEIRLTGRHLWCLAVQIIVSNNKPCLANKITMEVTFTGEEARMLPDTLAFDTDALKHEPAEATGDFPTYTIECTEGVEGTRNLNTSFEMYYPLGDKPDGHVVQVDVMASVDGMVVRGSKTVEMKPQLSEEP
jgi:hypothetical protein